MKKILVMPDGNWLAHTSRPYEISKQLRILGYEVIFASDGKYMQLPRESGFDVIPIISLDPEHALRCERSGRVNYYRYEFIKESVEADLSLLNRIKPDLVLTDFRLPTKISCELAKIPLAVILNAFWTDYSTVRMHSPESLPITRLVGQKTADYFIELIKYFIITYDNRPFNKLRKERGLKPTKNFWGSMSGDLNLMADIPQYSPTKNLPANFHYIGPILWEPESGVPDWLEKLDGNKPTIYFTMGSSGYGKYFEKAIDIFKNTEFQCIMTTAGLATEKDTYPENIFVAELAPGSKLLEKSDLVVCQGGNGTIYQAMSMGVPIIGIPAIHDQEFNLNRVEALGLGIQLSERKFKPNHLTDAVNRILNDEKYKRKAVEFKEVLSSYNGPNAGAELIDDFIKA